MQLERLGGDITLGRQDSLPLPSHPTAMSDSQFAQPASSSYLASPRSGSSKDSPSGVIAGLSSPHDTANALEAAVGCGPGVMEVQGSSPRFHGRGAGALFCIDSETVRVMPCFGGYCLFSYY